MASSTKTCRNWLAKEDVFKLRDVKIPEELKKRRKPIVASDDIKTELKRGELSKNYYNTKAYSGKT